MRKSVGYHDIKRLAAQKPFLVRGHQAIKLLRHGLGRQVLKKEDISAFRIVLRVCLKRIRRDRASEPRQCEKGKARSQATTLADHCLQGDLKLLRLQVGAEARDEVLLVELKLLVVDVVVLLVDDALLFVLDVVLLV